MKKSRKKLSAKALRILERTALYGRDNATIREDKAKVSASRHLINYADAKRFNRIRQILWGVSRLRKNLGIVFNDSTSLAMSEKTGTREWDKTDTPPTTITLSTLRTSAAIFRRVGICA